MTTTNTIKPMTLVENLFSAIDLHETSAQRTHDLYLSRGAALKSLRDAGFTHVQDGRSKKLASGALPYADLPAFFAARLLVTKKAAHMRSTDSAKPFVPPTAEQIKADCKQQIFSLNEYLKTGEFYSNVGRDKPKREYDNALAAFVKAEKDADKAAKAAKDAANKAAKDAANKAAKEAELAALELANSEVQQTVERLELLPAGDGVEAVKADLTDLADEIVEQITDKEKGVKILAPKVDASKKAAEMAQRAALLAEQARVLAQAKLDEAKRHKEAQENSRKPPVNVRVSEECRLEAAEMLAELEVYNPAPASLLELARLIQAKYASKN